jgi:hypothetical protein
MICQLSTLMPNPSRPSQPPDEAMPPLITEVFFAVKDKEDKTPDIFGRGGAMALAKTQPNTSQEGT